MATDYRVQFTITRRQDGDDDFTEVGFGSSAAWHSISAAAYEVESILEHGVWETTAGMPEPAELMSDDTREQP